MAVFKFLGSPSMYDRWVLFNLIIGMLAALIIEFRNDPEKMSFMGYLKAALFSWIFGAVIGLPFGDSWFFASGENWYQFLGSLLYVPAIIASFCIIYKGFPKFSTAAVLLFHRHFLI